ncbi:hypothetical protein BGZ92_006776 [Podila epicladia]|nr:hypothetical protein BGZ92_006776 [Podila epicladia]
MSLLSADGLEKLGTVFLRRFRGVIDGHVQDTISFLSRNRIAYPRKKSAQIEFDEAPLVTRLPFQHSGSRESKMCIQAAALPVDVIEISFPPGSFVRVGDFGDFGDCSFLKTLNLVPNSYLGSSQFSNDMHEFAHVAPVCKLSCIKSLNLAGTAAQQFNSLDYYTGLEALITESNSEFGRSMPIGDAPDLVQDNGIEEYPLDVLTSSITVYTPSVTALQMERIEDGLDLVGHGGTQYEDQCCKRSSKLWTIIAAAIKRSRQAGMALGQ